MVESAWFKTTTLELKKRIIDETTVRNRLPDQSALTGSVVEPLLHIRAGNLAHSAVC